VQAGTALMAIVPLSAVYVTTNYEETQLTNVQPGQPVTMGVDMFPSSSEEFALLPDNATGNFTKIVQRIPVKITIDPHDPLAGRHCVRECRSSRRSIRADQSPPG
jgi:membrane fusion protein, multidrug efflux system